MIESPECFMIISLISQQKRYKSLNYVNNSFKSDFKKVSIGMPSSPTSTDR